ncbi:hypothetical protein ZWY2020_058440 [Hordeum vulgare]|nr:hypothetical protein ZWY2020_058440 [Hordeum vulgare]
MDKMSDEDRGVYALLCADFTADLDERFKDHIEKLLQAANKIIEANTAMLDGPLLGRIDGVHEELALELESVRDEWQKEPPRCAEVM